MDGPAATKPVTNGVNGLLVKPHEKTWWKEAVVYQVYPASFKDSNDDGTGDLNGITSKLDYLKDLGVDVVWLSPIFQSPLVDMGYDISDYEKIDPRYGTNEDVLHLLSELHKRDMKLLLDLVVNHTSDQHAWFKESASSKENSKSDWYIWKPAKKGSNGERIPPNNWGACFGGSVWEWCEARQEYYLHYFCPEQPDLNWENPDVREAVWDVMKFWLDQGVDGFRMDVINMVSKDLEFPNSPIVRKNQFIQPAGASMVNGPRIHEFLREMNEKVISKYDIMNVGETPGTYDIPSILNYVHKDRQELQMVFDFSLVSLDGSPIGRHIPREWTLAEFKAIVERFCTGLYEGGWWAIYLENHDQCRSVSRWTSDLPQWRVQAAKLLALMELTLFGTPYVYQGQELGMINLPPDYPDEEYKDVSTINRIQMVREEGGPNVEESVKHIHSRARDNARAPMQWDSSPFGGFMSASPPDGERPWMLPSPDYKKCNAASQVKDPKSVFSFWKKMIAVRKANEGLIYGKFELLSSTHEQIFAYTRTILSPETGKPHTFLILLNFRAQPIKYHVPVESHPIVGDLTQAKEVIGTYGDEDETYGKKGVFDAEAGIDLRPFEGRCFRI